jgi:hypothetical protein
MSSNVLAIKCKKFNPDPEEAGFCRCGFLRENHSTAALHYSEAITPSSVVIPLSPDANQANEIQDEGWESIDASALESSGSVQDASCRSATDENASSNGVAFDHRSLQIVESTLQYQVNFYFSFDEKYSTDMLILRVDDIAVDVKWSQEDDKFSTGIYHYIGQVDFGLTFSKGKLHSYVLLKRKKAPGRMYGEREKVSQLDDGNFRWNEYRSDVASNSINVFSFLVDVSGLFSRIRLLLMKSNLQTPPTGNIYFQDWFHGLLVSMENDYKSLLKESDYFRVMKKSVLDKNLAGQWEYTVIVYCGLIGIACKLLKPGVIVDKKRLGDIPTEAILSCSNILVTLSDRVVTGYVQVLVACYVQARSMTWIDGITQLPPDCLRKFNATLASCGYMKPEYSDEEREKFQKIVSRVNWNDSNYGFIYRVYKYAATTSDRNHFVDCIIPFTSDGSQMAIESVFKDISDLSELIYASIALRNHIRSAPLKRPLNKVYSDFQVVLKNKLFYVIVFKNYSAELKTLSLDSFQAFQVDINFILDLFDSFVEHHKLDLAIETILSTELSFFIINDYEKIAEMCRKWIYKKFVSDLALASQFSAILVLFHFLVDAFRRRGRDLSTPEGNSLKDLTLSFIKYNSHEYRSWIGSIKDIAQVFPSIEELSNDERAFYLRLNEVAVKCMRSALDTFLENATTNTFLEMKRYIDIKNSEENGFSKIGLLILRKSLEYGLEKFSKLIGNIYRYNANLSALSAFADVFVCFYVNNGDYWSYTIAKSVLGAVFSEIEEYVLKPYESGSISFEILSSHTALNAERIRESLVKLAKCSDTIITIERLRELDTIRLDFDKDLEDIGKFLNVLVGYLDPKCEVRHTQLDQISSDIESLKFSKRNLAMASIENGLARQQILAFKTWPNILRFLSSTSTVFGQYMKLALRSELQNEETTFEEYCNKAIGAAHDQYKSFLESLVLFEERNCYDILMIWTNASVDVEVNLIQNTKFEQFTEYLEQNRDHLENLTKLNVYITDVKAFLLCIEILTSICELSIDVEPDILRFVSLPESNAQSIANRKLSVKEMSSLVNAWKKCTGLSARNNESVESYSRTMDIIKELSCGRSLIALVKELPADSTINFLDIVEVNSENSINADVLIEFDMTRRFIKLLLESTAAQCGHPGHLDLSLQFWFKCIRSCSSSEALGDHRKLPASLSSSRQHCNALHDIFYSVANREESTKRVVKSILESGSIVWCRTESSYFYVVCTFTNSSGGFEKRDRLSVDELRSRALLLVNSTSRIDLGGK